MDLSVDLINSCSSRKELLKKLGWTTWKITMEVRKLTGDLRVAYEGLIKRAHQLSTHRHTFDEIFFLTESPDFYYFLGFLLGDGCISTKLDKQQNFQLWSSNKEFIEGYRAKVSATHKIQESRQKEFPERGLNYGLTITSQKICDRLLCMGVPVDKSHIDGWNVQVPDEYMNFMLRGLCDSDGCIYGYKDKTRNSMVCFESSSGLLLEGIKKFLNTMWDIEANVRKMKTIYQFNISGPVFSSLFNYIYFPELDWDMKSKRLRGMEILAKQECVEAI